MAVPIPRIPERPLLKPWFRLARDGERIALEYGQAVVVLEGRATVLLLPALLPLLDGRRTREQILATLGEAAAPALDNALETLTRAGLLTGGPPLGAEVPRTTATCAEWLAAGGPGHVPPAEILAALSRATIGVAGSGPQADAIARLLRISGVGAVEQLDWEPERASLRRVDLLLAVPAPGELPRLEGWNRSALDAGSPWLQVLPFDGRFAAVGPLYVPGETCCFQCYRLRRAGNVPYPDEFWPLERTPAPFPTPPVLVDVLAGLAVHDALRWIAHRDPSLPGAFAALELGEGLSLARHHVYRVPRCPACSVGLGRGGPLPWFEAAIDGG